MGVASRHLCHILLIEASRTFCAQSAYMKVWTPRDGIFGGHARECSSLSPLGEVPVMPDVFSSILLHCCITLCSAYVLPCLSPPLDSPWQRRRLVHLLVSLCRQHKTWHLVDLSELFRNSFTEV